MSLKPLEILEKVTPLDGSRIKKNIYDLPYNSHVHPKLTTTSSPIFMLHLENTSRCIKILATLTYLH